MATEETKSKQKPRLKELFHSQISQIRIPVYDQFN